MYIDEAEAVKTALGGPKYSNFWLLKPSVIRAMVSFVRRFGAGSTDVTDKKTQLLGGTFVVRGGEVVYAHVENSNFDNGDANQMLAAVIGESAKEPSSQSAPGQAAEACRGA